MCFGVCLVKAVPSNDLGREFIQTDSLLTNTFSLQIHQYDILRHIDYDELIKYNLNVNTDRWFVPGTTLVGPRSNQAAS